MVEIKIPWYRKNIKKVQALDFNSNFNPFDFPDGKRRKKKNKKPDPKPRPQLQPETVKVYENEINPIPESQETTIPFGLPTRNPLTDYSGRDRIPTKTPTRNPLPDIYGKDRIPKPNLSPSIKTPSSEILFKLMEAEPSGKYDKFLKNYNEISLELYWNITNPFIIFKEPSYSQVKKFLDNNDLNKITSKDVTKYFENIGVRGKDLKTLPTRIYTFKKTIDALNAIEDVVIPEVPTNRKDET